VKRIDQAAEAESVGQQNEFLAVLGAGMAGCGQEPDAFDPFVRREN
jgi:hypothetical protein